MSKQFLNLSIFMPFSDSSIFCFTSSTLAKLSLWLHFSSGETKFSCLGEIGQIGRVGHSSCVIFGQKLLNIWYRMGTSICKSPIMKWANALEESSKKFTEAKHSLPLIITSAGTLIQMGSWNTLLMGPAIRKIIWFLLDPPLVW